MKHIKSKLVFLSVLGVISLLFLAFYLTVQQTLRLGANEPQESMAQAAAQKLQNGYPAVDLAQGHINMESDMAPFLIIYDQYGKVQTGNGYLHNAVPQVPVGVLAAAKGHSTNAVTWQPEDKVRIASVSTQAGDHYVLAGRSLYVIEKKIQSFGRWLLLAWLGTVALLVLAYLLIRRGHGTTTTPILSEQK